MFRKKKPDALDIEAMAFGELKILKEHIEASMSRQFDEAREAFRLEIIEKMSTFGLTLDDFKPPKRKKRVVIKYRDPDNEQNTWSGLGKPKKWLQEKLDAGQQLQEFAVL